MDISIEIDRFTPCLINKHNGEIVNTDYAVASKMNLNH